MSRAYKTGILQSNGAHRLGAVVAGEGRRGAGGRHCSMEAGEDGRGGGGARVEEDRWVAARAGGRRAPVGSARGVREPVGRWTKHDRWGAAQAGGAVGWGVRGRAVSSGRR
jgi:hypothetical protein